MRKKIIVNIGIPAYNEEANIKFLLKSMLDQKLNGIKLGKIIVVSDGSTDKTNVLVKSIKDKKIKLISNKKRLGLNQTQNIILKNSNSDILIMVDADILPRDNNFITKIIEPLINNKSIAIVSCKMYAIRDPQLYSRVLANSAEMKRNLYQNLPNPNSIYLCHGSVRAFSKEFYKKLKWPDDVPEDAYSYLVAKTKGYKFLYIHNPIVYFHTPGNLDDHINQNKRFIGGKTSLEKYFDKEYLKREYEIAPKTLLKYLLIYLYKRPFSTPIYLALMIYINVFKDKKITNHSKYEIAKSSKRLIHRLRLFGLINLIISQISQ